MLLLEYEAKHFLSTHNIPIPVATILHPPYDDKIALPAVIKSQVPIGGRGKAGGIRIVEDMDEANQAITQLLNLDIGGFKSSTLLIEEKLSIKQELYLALLIDREAASVSYMAHRRGGVEVEENDHESYLLLQLRDFKKQNQIDFDQIGQTIADYYNLADQTFALQDLTKCLYECFMQTDATLIEINPLVLTHDNKLVAGDCKMILDDAATFRHSDWQFEYTAPDSNFVTLNYDGTVATIANGAGLAMATVDSVSDTGLSAANFLDIGGGANEASVSAAFQKLMEYPNISSLLINIFAGITRCDEVAKAILLAKDRFPNLPPLYIRLDGTNYKEARQLLEAENIPLLDTLEDCIDAIKKANP